MRPTLSRLALVKGLNDRKIVQISAGPQHSLAVDSNGCVIHLVPFPPQWTRRELTLTLVIDTSSSGVVQATAVSASGTNKILSSQSSSPLFRAIEKSRAARLSTPGRHAALSSTVVGCTGLRASGRFRVMGVQASHGAASDSCRISCE